MEKSEKKILANKIIDVITPYNPVDAMDVMIDVLAAVIVTSKKDDLSLLYLANAASRDLLRSMEKLDRISKKLN